MDLSDYDDKHLACRDLRHAWSSQGFFRRNGAVRRRLVCLRCETVRYDEWAGSLTPRRQYDYPEGYRVAEGRVYGVDVRDEVLRRSFVYRDEESLKQALKRRSATHGRRRNNVIDLRDVDRSGRTKVASR